MTKFSRIEVRSNRRELLVDGLPVMISGPAFDILNLLISANGELVSKDAIMLHVWPDKLIDENNLQVHMSALRKALGADRDVIKTVWGQGYRFVMPSNEKTVSQEVKRTSAKGNLPLIDSPLIGRQQDVREVNEHLLEHRVITLTGPGGIGKTRLLIEVAKQQSDNFPGGVWFVELAPLTTGCLVADTIGATLGLRFAGGAASAERIAKALGDNATLILLDNCEHVIHSAAQFVEALVRLNPSVSVVTTSRELLRIECEHLYHVLPLAVPTPGLSNANDLLPFAAVQLFLSRMKAADQSALLEGRLIALVSGICRQLDGNPLAIVLAAARAASLGIEGLADGLHDRLKLLRCGYRTSLQRHQTLRAALDWSYELLGATEKKIFRQLGFLSGSFDQATAVAVAGNAGDDRSEILNSLSELVEKSLIQIERSTEGPHYKLHETTRLYALEKLKSHGEFVACGYRHADFIKALLVKALRDYQREPSSQWLKLYKHQIDNVRTALEWSFSPVGNTEIGIDLAAGSIPLLMELSLVDECRVRLTSALAAVDAVPGSSPKSVMQLRSGLAVALTFTHGPSKTTASLWSDVLDLASKLGDQRSQAKALWGLWTARVYGGEPRAALEVAKKFAVLAEERQDVPDILMSHRLLGVSLHFYGEQRESQRELEYLISRYIHSVHHTSTVGYQVDQGLVARTIQARTLWVQGFPDQATSLATEVAEQALACDHIMTRCYALIEATIPISLIVGDYETSAHYLAILRDTTSRHGLEVWSAWARCFQHTLALLRRSSNEEIAQLRNAVEALRTTSFTGHFTSFLGILAEALCRSGALIEAEDKIQQALTFTFINESYWNTAELLRIKGEVLTQLAKYQPAESSFLEALKWARQQEAFSWELRVTTCLARLWVKVGRQQDAYELMQISCSRIREGSGSTDVINARQLLEELRFGTNGR